MKRNVILTIDDAPSANFKAKVDLLIEHKINAVFFCIGNKIEQHRGDLIHALKQGFILGNHSYTHPWFSSITSREGFEEIRKTDELLNDIYTSAGIHQEDRKRFFRFPYGDAGDGKYGYHQNNKAAAKQKHFTNLIKNKAYSFKKITWLLWHDLASKKGKKYEDLQKYLLESGYENSQEINTRYNDRRQGHLPIDWRWDFDTRDWCLNSLHSPISLDNEMQLQLVDRIQHHFSASYNNSIYKNNEIILCHDYDYNYDFIKNLVIRLKNLNVGFISFS